MAGIDEYTKLMLHCNGDDASQTFIDSEITPKTVTAVGNAQLDTAYKQFGTASGLFDGTGDWLTVPDSTDWDFGNGNFTIDFWVRFNTVNAIGGLISQFVSTASYWGIYTYSNGKIYFDFHNPTGAGAYTASTTSLSADTWYHFEFSRITTSAKFFIDGVSQTLTEANAFDDITFDNLASVLYVGNFPYGGAYVPFHGWIDEFRISKGIARHTSDFTPPTSEYSAVVETNMKVKISDTFKDVDSLQINIGDTWKDVVAVQQNIGDVWKDVF